MGWRSKSNSFEIERRDEDITIRWGEDESERRLLRPDGEKMNPRKERRLLRPDGQKMNQRGKKRGTNLLNVVIVGDRIA